MNLRRGKVFIIIIVLLFVFIGVKVASIINNPLKITTDTIVEIKKGDSFYSILDKLDNQSLLNSKEVVKVYIKISKNKIDIKEGNFILKPGMSLKEIIDTLNSAPAFETIRVTIPEGYTIEKIAKVLEQNNICTYDEFISAVESYNLPEYVKDDSSKRYSLEGFLFPDTYFFNDKTTPDEVIKIMLQNFERVMNDIQKENNITINKSDYEKIVTIASLIQNETRLQSEAPIISSVIYNRLKKGMNLKIDATVIYALGYHVDLVLNSHLKIDSLYNTYKNSGLPIGPISNPGKIALEAAIKPAETDYLFYLLKDVTGQNPEHYFTNSDVDFMKKRQEYGYNNL